MSSICPPSRSSLSVGLASCARALAMPVRRAVTSRAAAPVVRKAPRTVMVYSGHDDDEANASFSSDKPLTTA